MYVWIFLMKKDSLSGNKPCCVAPDNQIGYRTSVERSYDHLTFFGSSGR